ncbi:MAG: amidophosphoribosyltransferase [Clostridia bacterium]|nr:amidophosphoribosyltransferase [Clostridia bacterium]
MSGFFGAVCKRDVIEDVFYGTDYHSHLGTRKGGMAAYDRVKGLSKDLHNINNAPFRTKFEKVFEEMSGCAAIGCISDSDPQPLLIRSSLGVYAISTIGIINNAEELIKKYLSDGGFFTAQNGGSVNSTELFAALLNKKNSFVEGIRFAQSVIDGTASVLILTENGQIIAARDLHGRLPVVIGTSEDGNCVSFESFAYKKLGYEDLRELGSGEIVMLTADDVKVLAEPLEQMRICSFLWTYYGYPNSNYEGVNVEISRYRNGEYLAEREIENGTLPKDLDCVAGVPDSGTPHAIGYANKAGIPFARPFIKYTPTWPRSFMPTYQAARNKIAKMKLVPVHELIQDKNILFVDDSIVRGTQLKETVEFLYENGAKSVHMRSACPPIMYGCKYLNFSPATSDMELIARRTVKELEGDEGFSHLEEYSDSTTERGKALRKAICDKFGFSSLEFASLDDVCKSIGIGKCKLCTYCWNGKE